MNRERFSELVTQALDNLPEAFLELLDNVEITVDDYPDRHQLQGDDDCMSLLGLYEGVPLTERGAHYNLVLPDKITIFQKPIEAICHTDADIIDQVETTVRHEVAHHFGLSDEELDQIEENRASS
ncbi:MAG: metallopeptidase family protein [Dehalogenimonas sp.]|jgi:predicted Zn-dependent protease with MMP-like domain|uniref:Metallopeptidase family protein n=1 Tax=Candidatus Dehalogenimonas loeffleri TaxID=3127115 RepID=A0ABZ2JA91_9CHLR|nr:metallopeptidase family protein [Dehalogenimonas sp.]